jgi:hypothetical protein
VQYLIGVALFGSSAVIGTWVAFAGDARQFSGGLPLLGTFALARIGFGLGALIDGSRHHRLRHNGSAQAPRQALAFMDHRGDARCFRKTLPLRVLIRFQL